MGVVYCAIDVRQYCRSAGNAGGRGQQKDDEFVHNILKLKHCLVNVKLPLTMDSPIPVLITFPGVSLQRCSRRPILGPPPLRYRGSIVAVRLSLYTILPLPILYGVWHTQGGSGGGRILRMSRAIVLQ